VTGLPWRADGKGLMVAVRLTPKGGRDAVDGVSVLSDGRPVLAARVRAAPDKGAANAALLAVIAEAAGVPRSAVTLVSGATARQKQVHIEGDAATLGKAAGKDAEAGKATLVAALGINGARARLGHLIETADSALAPFGAKADTLRAAARFIAERQN